MSARPQRSRPWLRLLLAAALAGSVGAAAAVAPPQEARAAACPVTLLEPADGSVVGDSPLFRWAGACSQYRVWFSPSGTFVGDVVRSPWSTQKRYRMNQVVWDGYQEGAWSGGVHWKVQSKAADGTLSFSSTRSVSMAPITRFIAVGDTGTGSATQYDVAAAMEGVCATEGCDFVLLLGDNIYEDGVDSPDPAVESDWDAKFELPYAAFTIPFYPVMGNHDYGEVPPVPWPPPIITTKADAAVDHTAYSSIWTMPSEYYDFTHGDVSFFALDTSQPLLGATWLADQVAAMGAAVSASTSPWKVAFGHYPYYSNGHHGDAGTYDGVPGRGAEVKTLLDDVVCGQVDLYLCGHDHSLQWMTDTCAGTELIVSGAGASSTTLTGSHPTEFQQSTPGFYWLEIQDVEMHVVAYDSTGAVLHDERRYH